MDMKKYLKMPLYVASLALMTAGVASCSERLRGPHRDSYL